MKAEADRIGQVPLSFGNALTKEVNRQQLVDIKPKMESVEERLADMDRMGVDIQALAIAPYQTYYWADPVLGAEVSRIRSPGPRSWPASMFSSRSRSPSPSKRPTI